MKKLSKQFVVEMVSYTITVHLLMHHLQIMLLEVEFYLRKFVNQV